MADSAVYSVTPGAQAGYVHYPSPVNVQNPAIWSGTQESLVRIQNPSLVGGIGTGISPEQLVVTSGGTPHAYVYDRASQAATDLHPPGLGATGSRVFGVASGQQVGFAFIDNNERAALWTGTAASFMNLHPAGATWSIAHATNGNMQGGDAAFGTSIVAGIWTGTAASFVNLNPTQLGVAGSQLRGMGGNQQVGRIYPPQTEHAALWRGTASSCIDLNPSWAEASAAYGTDGVFQVGDVASPNFSSACIWSGTPESCIRLDQFLPPGYSSSIAYSVCQDQGRIIVGGVAFPNNSSHTEAFIWVLAPAPSTLLPIAFGGLALSRRRRSSARLAAHDHVLT